MPGGFSNKPKILRGAFVEYGLSIPPLFVVFQFNPVQLSRNRTLTFNAPGSTGTTGAANLNLRDFHTRSSNASLMDIRDGQQVRVQAETITFEIRLDASDKLNDGDPLAEQFGIAPQLSALELMVHPKNESLLSPVLSDLLGESSGFSFTESEKPPMVLFIWGRKRVMPVNITSLATNETEFSTDLNPLRANITVNLTVIEGPNPVSMYTKIMKEAMAVINLANISDIADVAIPG